MDRNICGDDPSSAYRIEVVRHGPTNPGIRVEFVYSDSARYPAATQRGGQLRLNPEVARWLGQALIAAGDVQTANGTLVLEVSNDDSTP